MTKNTKDLRKLILLSYSSLGSRPKSISNRISFYHCHRWMNPVMSPAFLQVDDAAKKDFEAIAKHFLKGKSRGSFPYDSAQPYLNFIPKTKSHLSRAKTLSASLGWEHLPRQDCLNAWDKALPLELPKNYYFASGRYFERPIYRAFLKTMQENFKSTPKFMIELNHMIKGIEPNLRTVIIYHSSGQIAGAGLVSTANGTSYLFCGSIMKRHRGKGLWRSLVAARQLVSLAQGSRFWITTTGNPLITKKGQYSFQVHRFFMKVATIRPNK